MARFSGNWIPTSIKKALAELDPLWQNVLDPRMKYTYVYIYSNNAFNLELGVFSNYYRIINGFLSVKFCGPEKDSLCSGFVNLISKLIIHN